MHEGSLNYRPFANRWAKHIASEISFILEVVSKPQIRFKGPAEAGLHV
jgi:hypothetical protein